MSPVNLWARLRGWDRPIAADSLPPPQRGWTYVPSRIGYYTRYLRLKARVDRGRFPQWTTISAPFPAKRWALYFMYLPEGRVRDAHRFTIDRLRAGGARVLVVVASIDQAAADLVKTNTPADAVIWKALPGFDFSAYTLGITAIARHSPGASLFVMNDSVLGPFGDIEALVDQSPWDLTGFTASSRIENHIQSYAFHLRCVTAATLDALSPTMSLRHAFDKYVDVVYGQETQFARVASRHMSVGALWYADHPMADPSLYSALSMLAEGYPFLKRKLFFEHQHLYPAERLADVLNANGHPLPALAHPDTSNRRY